ncbi:MAG: protein kinase domain-containing protein [Pyrinomonadaceae bacterium]
MIIDAGTRLGRYEIRSKIGEGGMGVVYRARDEKLNRDVAIKVLPPAFSEDVDRLRRFEQEAQATGTLNHPNILAVYDVGAHEGAPYVVSELLEGETLRQRLNEGSLGERKAIDYAVQIAGGLAAAHEKAIVHRDLKPDNIFITKDDRVKILDFGLAKLVESMIDGHAQTDIATRKLHTDPGTVVGTVGYMSPEQVRGQHVDHRSDVFSFGVVLYEMLSGRRAFHGDSAVETLNAILKDEPAELSQTSAKINPALERIVRRCLEKKPERRFQSAYDLTFAIEEVLTPSGPAAGWSALPPGVGEAQMRPKIWRLLGDARLAWIAAAALLLGTMGFAWSYFRRQPAVEARVMKFSIMPPEKTNFDHIAVSPDGKWLAFTAATGGKVQLWMRALEALEAKALAGTEGATLPFWSPGSRFIGFFAGGKLKKIEVSGGLPARLCDVRAGTGGTWSRDGVILFSALGGDGLSRVSASGGEVTSVIRPDWKRQESDFGNPFFLPDGLHFFYSKWSGQKEARGVYLASLDGALNQWLLPDDSNAVYAASDKGEGYLLFGREGALMAQPFDAARRQLTGEPFSVTGQVRTHFDNVISHRRSFSVSENGVLVFDPFPNRLRNQLIWVDREGKQTGSPAGPDNVSKLRLSPDDKRFMVERLDMQTGNNDLWLSDLTGGNATRFTFDPANDSFPVWSPDGDRIIWSSNREGAYHLYEKATNGAGQDALLLKSDYFKFPLDWSRDGRFIIYREINPKTKLDVWVLPVGPQAGEQKPFPVLQTEANETTAVLSPDGQWLAYSSDESGVYEIYVQSFPAGGGKRQVSRGGGIAPHWRGDGKELFYHAPDGKLMAAAVKGGASFEAGPPEALFDFRPSGNSRGSDYSVTADGQKFLLSTIVETEATAPLTVVINWTANLKR